MGDNPTFVFFVELAIWEGTFLKNPDTSGPNPPSKNFKLWVIADNLSTWR
jgi:hypothetical protein